MGGCERISRQDLQALLAVQSANIQVAASFYDDMVDETVRLEHLFHNWLDEDEDNLTLEPDELQATVLRQTGTDITLVASTLSEDHSRGPYDQIVKCGEYFEKALSWPDREFRYEFR